MIKTEKNSLAGNSFLIFIIRFFPSLANLLVMIWYSRHLPQALYGQYQNFWVQLYVLSAVACFGIHVLVVTYHPSFLVGLLRAIKPRQYIYYLLWLVAAAAVFALLQAYGAVRPLVIPFLFLLCFSASVVLESLLIVFRSYTFLAITNIIYAICFAFIHWYVPGSFSFQLLFGALLSLVAVRMLLYIVAAMRSIKTHTQNTAVQDGPLSSVRSLWLHLGVYDILQVLFSYVDKFIISLVLSAQLSAIYYNGSQNIPFLPLLLSAMSGSVLIRSARTKAQGKDDDLPRLMGQMGRILSCIVFPVFFFLFLFRYPLFDFLFSGRYQLAVPVFAASLLVLPLRSYHFTTGLQRLHKGSIINKGAIADLLIACGLMYPLFKLLGLPGVALAFVISTYLQSAYYLFYTARYLDVSVFKLVPLANWAIKLITFGALLISIRYMAYSYFSGYIVLILGGAAMSVMIAVSLLAEISNQKKYGGS